MHRLTALDAQDILRVDQAVGQRVPGADMLRPRSTVSASAAGTTILALVALLDAHRSPATSR